MDFKLTRLTSGREKRSDVTAERKGAKDSDRLEKLSITQELYYCENITFGDISLFVYP